MEFLFWFFGVFCLAYYGVIVCYSGPSTSFAPIWLVLSACLFIIATVVHFYDRFRDRISLRLEVSAVTALAAIFVVFVGVEIAMGVNFFSLDKQSADYVIVLGAQVRGKALSRTLEYRLEKALEYARVHPNTVLVLSGGQGVGEEMTEAEAMYEYLKAHGIPESPDASGGAVCQHLRKSGIQQAPDPGTGSKKTPDHPGRDGSVGLSVPSRRGGIHPRGDHNQQLPRTPGQGHSQKDRHPRHHRHRRQIRPGAVFTLLRPGMLRNPKR